MNSNFDPKKRKGYLSTLPIYQPDFVRGKIVCTWSGGITSAVACKLAVDLFGVNECLFVFTDTHNEHPDTYRFKSDCEKWYGKEIHTITAIGEGDAFLYQSIEDVWFRYGSLNVAHGAICSTELKRAVREEWQKHIEQSHKAQVFGFEFLQKEFQRACSLNKNHEKAKGIFPLLMYGMDKADCIKFVQDAGIEVPQTYQEGLNNNNCRRTGCVQGGIGYWQFLKWHAPPVFYRMAMREHFLTDLKGKPVTLSKDQSKEAKESGNQLVFLVKHPKYPHLKSISEMKGREPESLFDCNGFCSLRDLWPRRKAESEVNFPEEESPQLPIFSQNAF